MPVGEAHISNFIALLGKSLGATYQTSLKPCTDSNTQPLKRKGGVERSLSPIK
jgi:hypothetical protein